MSGVMVKSCVFNAEQTIGQHDVTQPYRHCTYILIALERPALLTRRHQRYGHDGRKPPAEGAYICSNDDCRKFSFSPPFIRVSHPEMTLLWHIGTVFRKV